MSLVSRITDFAQAVATDIKALNSGKLGAAATAANASKLGGAAPSSYALIADLNSRAVTDTGTSGATSKQALTLTATPAGVTTQQLHAQSITSKYQSANNMNPGGWLVSLRLENQLIGSAQVDKSVVAAAYTTGVGGGRIDKALGFEAVVGGLDGTTSINQYGAFYSANLAAVPGITNITAAYAFANDWSGAIIKNVGRYIKALDRVGGSRLREVAPSPHPGYIADRYYGAAIAFNPTPQALIAGFGYPVLFQCHERTAFSKIGCRVTTGGAAGATLRLGIYYAEGGLPSGLIYDSGAIACTAVGDVEKTGIGVTLEAGSYILLVTSTDAPQLQSVTSFEGRGQWGRTTSTGEESTPLYAVGAGAYPSGFAAPAGWFGTGGTYVDIWMRK